MNCCFHFLVIDEKPDVRVIELYGLNFENAKLGTESKSRRHVGKKQSRNANVNSGMRPFEQLLAFNVELAPVCKKISAQHGTDAAGMYRL
ncbi:unnamed protein product [Heligmosomoides polygyrus]|uniref:Uncharacterized protein n=1 Tax=Heligmosomoides polygyrus TaxID=6339 RepID=A0A3P8HPK9_HELPZ|nr:unnamed protein product [Heligmosomoides polygyrus]